MLSLCSLRIFFGRSDVFGGTRSTRAIQAFHLLELIHFVIDLVLTAGLLFLCCQHGIGSTSILTSRGRIRFLLFGRFWRLNEARRSIDAVELADALVRRVEVWLEVHLFLLFARLTAHSLQSILTFNSIKYYFASI